MKGNGIVPLAAVMRLALVTVTSSSRLGLTDSNNNYCYDQIGDGHFYFEKNIYVRRHRNMMK